jgi:hypothetical protein
LSKTRVRKSVFGWISLILAVVIWLLINCFFHVKIIPFSTFVTISVCVMVVPLILGVVGLIRKEKYILPLIIGIFIASLIIIWLLIINSLNGI